MLKVGQIGVGHLGRFHAQQWQNIPGVTYMGFVDPNDENAETIIRELGIKRYENIDTLIDDCDALDIVTPTTTHYDIAKKCLKKSKHIFIEKPLASDMVEAKEIRDMVTESGVVCQIGHIERFNPAILSLGNFHLQPGFMEVHRLAQYNPRGTDVSVVLDLMIHDLDIVLALQKSNVRKVNASGVKVVSDSFDIANARIEFENGSVANVTASRISLKSMRKIRLFQKDAYISLDFMEKKSEIVRFMDGESHTPEGLVLNINLPQGGAKNIEILHPQAPNINAINLELTTFVNSIVNNEPPLVSVEDGYNAMQLAYDIINQIEKNPI